MSIQTGALLYAFIDDRLDEKMRAQYPHGREEYEHDWRAVHDLQKDHGEAVSRHDQDRAERHLQALRARAAEWQGHPDFPADAIVAPTDPPRSVVLPDVAPSRVRE